MSEAWSQWEGHVVNDSFHLSKHLGDTERSAVFLTEYCGPEPQPAVIKLIAADPADAELQLSRWGLAQGLSHPHLLRILSTGRCQLGTREVIFAIMEYAEENLAQILPERALTVQETHDMLAPTLDALAYLHGQGFVHGHLKPANILAVKDQLKLATDGISRAGDKVSALEMPSPYDPPELPNGVRSRAGDTWSLGMTLVEVLTQRLPSWNRTDYADPVLPDNIPAPFVEVVRACLQRDPQRRSNALTIARFQFEEGLPEEAVRRRESTDIPQQPAAVRSSGGSGSWLWRSALPLMLAIVGLGALVAGFGFLRRQPESRTKAAATEPEERSKLPKPDAGKPSPREQQEPRSVGNHAPVQPITPQPASLRSEAGMPSRSGASSFGGIVRQVLPDVPQTALDTIQGTLKVSVKANVDPSGNVAAAELDSPGPSKYFARLSLQAAQNWKFTPPTENGGREFILYFEFRNDGVRAYARPGL